MGAISSVHLLDLDALRGFVDDLERWVTTGEVAPRWAEVLASRTRRVAPADRDRATLRDHPALLAELRLDPSESVFPDAPPLDERTRWCVELGVCAYAARAGAAFGNAVWVVHELAALEPSIDPLDDAAQRELPWTTRLQDGLAHWSRADGGFGEGLRGALDARGCARLLDELVWGEAPGDDPVGEARAARRLGVVRAMAERAVAGGCGLLHGRDLPAPLDG